VQELKRKLDEEKKRRVEEEEKSAKLQVKVEEYERLVKEMKE
jgi:hypothetical protein